MLFTDFLKKYDLPEDPFSRIHPFMIDSLLKEYNAKRISTLERRFYRSELCTFIMKVKPADTRELIHNEAYLYLYGACWGLPMNEISSVTTISIMKYYTTMLSHYHKGKIVLISPIKSTDVSFFMRAFDCRGYFATQSQLSSLLGGEEIEFEASTRSMIRKMKRFCSHPIRDILMSHCGFQNMKSLADSIKINADILTSSITKKLWTCDSAEAVIEIFGIIVPKKRIPEIYLTTYPFFINNEDNLTDTELAAKHGYIPTFRDASELRYFYSHPEEITSYTKDDKHYNGNPGTGILSVNEKEDEKVEPCIFEDKDKIIDYATSLFKYGLYLRGWIDGNPYDYIGLRQDLTIKYAMKVAEKAFNAVHIEDKKLIPLWRGINSKTAETLFDSCVIFLKAGEQEPIDRYNSI